MNFSNLINKIDGEYNYFFSNNQLVINGDSLELLPLIESNSIDLIITDPPYCGVLKNKWDNQWADINDFQEWTKKIAGIFDDKLKSNGALFWFGDTKNIAYCQIAFDNYFTLQNNLVWNKSAAVTRKGFAKFRNFGVVSERILFYDRGIKVNALKTIHSKKECFQSIKDYMRAERDKLKASKNITTAKGFERFMYELTDTKAMVARHYFSDNQYAFPSLNNYQKLQSTGFFQRDYYELKNEYENLKKSYALIINDINKKRRPWNIDSKAFDVLTFTANQKANRLHITEKPIKLIDYLVSRTTHKDSILLDPFAGSCVTSLVAYQNNLKSICIEKDPISYQKAIKRLKQYLMQDCLF
ncbi:DNA methyltransferase [Lentisphaerota bacterium WC36G]|nr:hypothetical protein LJT99_15415 [Lentisphaerae bacterium WC36]